jgi:hypothetical protein
VFWLKEIVELLEETVTYKVLHEAPLEHMEIFELPEVKPFKFIVLPLSDVETTEEFELLEI